MNLTLKQFAQIFPTTDINKLNLYLGPLARVLDKYEINTTLRIAAFFSQVGEESVFFTHTIENLNYSAAGLLATFHTHFTTVEAAVYQHNPQMIANRVYANRLGNGNEASGDGWRYKGRGLIQITGKNNYTAFATDIGMDLSTVPVYLETPEGATMSAGWFWDKNDLNTFADKHDIVTLTRHVNGGTNGLSQRQEIFNRATGIIT
jgi:putative chitinase